MLSKWPIWNAALDSGALGPIKRAHMIGGIAHKLGLVVMLAAYAWGAALLYLQFRRRDGDAIEEDS